MLSSRWAEDYGFGSGTVLTRFSRETEPVGGRDTYKEMDRKDLAHSYGV